MKYIIIVAICAFCGVFWKELSKGIGFIIDNVKTLKVTKNTPLLWVGFGFMVFALVFGNYKKFEPNVVKFSDFTQTQQDFYEKYLAYCVIGSLHNDNLVDDSYKEQYVKNTEGLCGCNAFCMTTSDTENVIYGFLDASLRVGNWEPQWGNLKIYCHKVCLKEWLEGVSKCAAAKGVDAYSEYADKIVVQKCSNITITKFIRKYLPKKFQPNNI